MPAKGYKKGFDDEQIPLPVSARARLPKRLYERMVLDASERRLTISKLMRAILEQHYAKRPLPRVKASGPSYAIARELNRIGVNLNQLTHLANATRLISATEIRRVLERITATLERL